MKRLIALLLIFALLSMTACRSNPEIPGNDSVAPSTTEKSDVIAETESVMKETSGQSEETAIPDEIPTESEDSITQSPSTQPPATEEPDIDNSSTEAPTEDNSTDETVDEGVPGPNDTPIL